MIVIKDSQRINELITEALAIDVEQAKEAGALGYYTKILIQATLPHRKPKENYFERVNGYLTLRITDIQGLGLPFGSYPRLLMSYLCTEAVKTKSPEIILGNNLSSFMNELGLSPTGGRTGTITRLREQAEKLFSCAISCQYKDSEQTSGKNILIADEFTLWHKKDNPDQTTLFKSNVILSQKFFEEIINSPVVFHLTALKALKQSPLAIDMYLWSTHRNSYIQKPTHIPWQSLQLQFGAGYPFTSQGKADFKKMFLNTLKKVSVVYPEVNKLRDEGKSLLFIPGKPHIPKISE